MAKVVFVDGSVVSPTYYFISSVSPHFALLSLHYSLHVSPSSVSVPLLLLLLTSQASIAFLSLCAWLLLLFSLSSVWNVVLSIVLPCNCNTSSSIDLAVRSPYLLRLHSVSPPQTVPEAQSNPPSSLFATPSSSHPSLSSSTSSG